MRMHRHSAATLMGLTKRELVEYVRIAEHNREVAEETLKQQAENVKDWMPAVHGRWIPIIDEPTPLRTAAILSMYQCSVCGRFEEKEEPYCNCGAKMDGGNEDGQ